MSAPKTQSGISRRDFLKASAITGACLLLGFDLEGKRVLASGGPAAASGKLQATGFEPAVFVRIDSDGTVTIIVPRSELGQGANTALPMILADELEADLSKVHIEQAPADSRYGNQLTGGSTSIQDYYSVLRRAGGIGRTMLITAAAQTWGVDAAGCYAELGTVIHRPSGKKLAYGELVATAAQLPAPVPGAVKLKDKKDFRYIGQPFGQIDNPHFVDGSARYASDIQLPGMRYAVVARCPTFGGKVASFDDSKAKAVPGVTDVVKISSGVAVVASSTWAALQGRKALQVTWDYGQNASLSSEGIRQAGLDTIKKAAASAKGNDEGVDHYIEAIYESPYLAHATMEPMNCVADVTADRCEVWAPTQNRQQAMYSALGKSRVKMDAVIVHVPTVGGAFGRRINVDYVEEAVEISKAVGKPIKLFWSRNDDLQHDFYRPASYHLLRAGVDQAGLPVIWRHYIASQGIGGLSDVTSGASSLSYKFRASASPSALPGGIPVGYWRSVFNPPNAYANESFMDELAVAAGKDPYEFRMQLLDDKSRMKPVLKMAAEKAGWGGTLPKGSGRGIACHSTWGASEVAQVVELSVDEGGNVKVSRVVCVIDCGVAVNPDMIAAQMEGGIVFGIGAALKDEVLFKNGQAQSNGFQDYRLVRIDEMPKVEVYIIPSDRSPGGVGEMGNPPTTPALLNAIYAATGKRLRRLPIRPEDFKQA